MDIEKEREAFELNVSPVIWKRIEYNAENNIYMAKSKYWTSNIIQAVANEIDFGWKMWQAAKAQAVPEWISVEDRLPPVNILVLGMSQTPRNIFNIYNVMALDEFEEADVTHWMPLPDAPQEQNQCTTFT